MRITKKLLKEAKVQFTKRCKELCLMTEEQLKKEVKRCFPVMTYDATHGELLNFMLQDLIDLCISPHWYQ